MHLVYLVVLLCALVAMNWRFLGLDKVFGGGGSGRLSFGKPCRWKRDPTRKSEHLDRYVCTACGVDAYSSDGSPPRQCKRNLRPGSL